MPSLREQFTTINISTLSFIKVLFIIALLTFLYVIKDVLAIIFVALILSSALSPWVAVMEKRGIPRPLGIVLIYASLISIFVLAGVLLVKPLSNEYTQLAAKFPEYSQKIIESIQGSNPGFDVKDQVQGALQSAQSTLVQVARGVFIKIFDILSGFVTFMLIFVVTFYMVVEEKMIRSAIHSVTPVRYRASIEDLIGQIQRKIGLWLRGQMVLCFIIFSLVFLGLTLFGVEYALILALFAGLTEFMPVIGPIVGSVPAIFTALNQSPWLALWVLLMYVVIQRIENDFIVPRVMQKAVGINPLVSIIALLIGGKIGGLIGVILAIPVATIIQVIVFDFFGTAKDES